MRQTVLILSAITVLCGNVNGQVLSTRDKEVLKAARARYYNLEAAGFQSLSCSVKFDFSTIPHLASGDDEATRTLLQQTGFTLSLDRKGPNVEHHYPATASAEAQQRAIPMTNLLSSLAAGLFQTWPSKGLQGPVPPFDTQIDGITTKNDGYVFSLRVPGAPVLVSTDKNYVVKEISSIGGKIIEQPIYGDSPDGLVFVGNIGTDNSGPNGSVTLKYELGQTVIDGLRLPSSARIQVNRNIDVKFALEGCSVKKAMVLHVLPPEPK